MSWIDNVNIFFLVYMIQLCSNVLIARYFATINDTRTQALALLLVRLAWQIVFLKFHASILKPYFDLLLAQAQVLCDFDASQSRQVLAFGKLVFEIEQLHARECRTNASYSRIGFCRVLVVIWKLFVIVVVHCFAFFVHMSGC